MYISEPTSALNCRTSAVRREPEIVNEIAEHLEELYDEARREGLAHEARRCRARTPRCRSSPPRSREISGCLPNRLARSPDTRGSFMIFERHSIRPAGSQPGARICAHRGFHSRPRDRGDEGHLQRHRGGVAPTAEGRRARGSGSGVFRNRGWPERFRLRPTPIIVDLRDSAGFVGVGRLRVDRSGARHQRHDTGRDRPDRDRQLLRGARRQDGARAGLCRR